MDPAAVGFHGFSPAALDFLGRLGENRSDRRWFESRRDVYERELLAPMKALVSSLGPFMKIVDSNLEVRPRVGLTISRLFRDVRFSKDKSLFRNRVWCSFKDRSLPEGERASFYFVVRPDGFGYGMGFYKASPAVMSRLRRKIRLNQHEFRGIVDDVERTGRFSLGGEKYKRLPEADPPPGLEFWFWRRNIYFYHDEPPGELLFSGALLSELLSGFSILSPVYCFIMNRPVFLRYREK